RDLHSFPTRRSSDLHDLGTVIGRCRLPRRKTLFRGSERRIEIGFARMRQVPKRLAGCRIDHVLALAAFAVEPFAVDVKTELGIHGNLVVTGTFAALD